MKFIHLSDLHLGKRVNDFSMIDDQRHILGQITEIIKNEKPDAVLIAGDVYDKPAPPAELRNVIECRNPRCITSVERGIPQRFRLVDKDTRSYRCVYCDTLYREK